MTEYIDIGKITKEISKILVNREYHRVLLQFPDGMKPLSKKIYDYIKENFPNIQVFIWYGTNFGACDIPIWLKQYGFDLVIHFGHTRFNRSFGLSIK